MEAGETQASRLTEVGVQVAARNLSEGRDEVEKEPVRAVVEQAAMPGVVQLYDPGHIAPDLFELLREVGEGIDLGGWELWAQPQGQRLQDGQDASDVPQLLLGEGPEPKAPSSLDIQHAFSRQAQQRLSNRGPADAKLLRQCRVFHSRPGGHLAPVDAGEDLVVDLLPEGRPVL